MQAVVSQLRQFVWTVEHRTHIAGVPLVKYPLWQLEHAV